MTGVRFFSGGRDTKKVSVAREILKLEMEKGGKLDPKERFKLIMKRKMEEHQQQVALAKPKNGKPMSLKAQQALKQVAAKKAAKDAKIMRQSVIVEKKIFSNGIVQKNGKVFDVAGNQIAVINKKNGRMTTNGGSALGQYKAKDRRTQAILVDAINKYSPYYMNLRKMQAMQAAGLDPRTGLPLNQEVINVHGAAAAMHGGNYQAPSNHFDMGARPGENPNFFSQGQNMYFDGVDGPRSVASTAWGAMSNNVWGTYGENVWGSTGDNVWGSQNSDIFGNAGFSLWGARGPNIWGTGNGVNHLRAVGTLIRKLFGRVNKQTVAAVRQARSGGGGATARPSASAARPASTPTARPTGRR